MDVESKSCTFKNKLVLFAISFRHTSALILQWASVQYKIAYRRIGHFITGHRSSYPSKYTYNIPPFPKLKNDVEHNITVEKILWDKEHCEWLSARTPGRFIYVFNKDNQILHKQKTIIYLNKNRSKLQIH